MSEGDIELSNQEWRRILVGLTLYRNQVQKEGKEELDDQLASLGMRIARNMEPETEGSQ